MRGNLTVKGVGWVQRFDAEDMEKKAEDALKMKKTIETGSGLRV